MSRSLKVFHTFIISTIAGQNYNWCIFKPYPDWATFFGGDGLVEKFQVRSL